MVDYGSECACMCGHVRMWQSVGCVCGGGGGVAPCESESLSK